MEADDKSQHVGKGMADADSDKMLMLVAQIRSVCVGALLPVQSAAAFLILQLIVELYCYVNLQWLHVTK